MQKACGLCFYFGSRGHFWATCALRPETQRSSLVSNNITPTIESRHISLPETLSWCPKSHFVPILVDETIAKMLNIPHVPLTGPLTVKTLDGLPLGRGTITRSTSPSRCPQACCMQKHSCLCSPSTPKIQSSMPNSIISWRKGELMA